MATVRIAVLAAVFSRKLGVSVEKVVRSDVQDLLLDDHAQNPSPMNLTLKVNKPSRVAESSHTANGSCLAVADETLACSSRALHSAGKAVAHTRLGVSRSVSTLGPAPKIDARAAVATLSSPTGGGMREPHAVLPANGAGHLLPPNGVAPLALESSGASSQSGQRVRWTKRKSRHTPRQPAWTAAEMQERERRIVAEIARVPEGRSLAAVLDAWAGRTTRVEMSTVVKALGAQRKAERALEVFRWMDRQRGRMRPNGHTYSLILGILGRAGMLDEARLLFARYCAAGFGDKVHGFNAMLHALLSHGHPDDAWALFQSMRQQPPLPRVLQEQQQTQQGQQQDAVPLPMLTGFGVPVAAAAPTAAPTTAVPSAVAATDTVPAGIRINPDHSAQPSEAPAARADGRADSDGDGAAGGGAAPAPDVVTYNIMMSAGLEATGGRRSKGKTRGRGKGKGAGSSGGGASSAVRQALALYGEMKARGVKPSSRTFNILVSLLGSHGLLSQAEWVVGEMRREGLGVDAYTLNSLMTMYTRADRPDDAIRTYERAVAAGIQPSRATHTALMAALTAAGRHSDAVAAFHRMLAAGFSADVASCGALLAALAEAGEAERAEGVLVQMQGEHGVTPNAIAYSSVIMAYGRQGRWEEAARVFEMMVSAGCPLDVQGFNILMAAYAPHGLSASATHLFRRLQSHGLHPDAITYNTLIHTLVKAGLPSAALRAFEHMRRGGCEPDHVTRCLMARILHEAGRHADAELMLRPVPVVPAALG